jgi:hypothetical protein
MHRRTIVLFAALVVVVWIVSRVNVRHAGRVRIALPSHPTQSSRPYVTPAPDAVWHAGGYDVQPCGARTLAPTLFTPAAIAGRPGGDGYSHTEVVDAGQLDLRDGRLWVTGGEWLPYLDEAVGVVTPPGTFPVTLLTAQGAHGPDVAAVLVRVADTVPMG